MSAKPLSAKPPPASSRITSELEAASGRRRITIPPPAPGFQETLQMVLIHAAAVMALGIFYWFIAAVLRAPQVDAAAVFLATVFVLGPVVYGMILVAAFAYRQLRPALPEVFVLGESTLTWDPGTAARRGKWSWNDLFPREIWTAFFPHRTVREFDAVQLLSLKLGDGASGGARLTIDQGDKRWHLAAAASPGERQWLFAVLGDHFRLPSAAAGADAARQPAAVQEAPSGIIVETDSGNRKITVPFPDLGCRRAVLRLGLVLAVPGLAAWACGRFADLCAAPTGWLPVQIPFFLLLLLLGALILVKAGQYAGPLRPEVFLLAPAKMIYDSGTPFLRLPLDFGRSGWRDLADSFFRRRVRTEFDPVELESLRLEETKTGSRLILARGGRRYELAGAAGGPEKAWLCRVLREHYRLAPPERPGEHPAPPVKSVRMPRAAASH